MKTSLTPVVICSDARRIPLADGSVHCVVTSPPYWGLRAYGGDPGMIGLEPTFDDHLGNLVEGFREVWRVLRDDGTLWLNYGDAYASGTAAAASRVRPELTGGVSSWGGASAREEGRNATAHGSGLKPKDLMMMPARVAMALQADGWWLRSEIVWHKPNPMPESCTDRPTSSHEKVFLMTKKPRYFYDADAVREALSKASLSQYKTPYDPNSVKVHTDTKSYDGSEAKRKMTAGGVPSGANLRNVWKIPTHGYPGAHFATFPPALAKRCILAGTSAAGVCAGCGAPWVRQVEVPKAPRVPATGKTKDHPRLRQKTGQVLQDWRDKNPPQTTGWLPSCTCDAGRIPATVFDPFGGSGTVGICAEELGRRSALLDINPEYCQMARERIDAQQPSLPLLE